MKNLHHVKINGLSVAYNKTGTGPFLVLLHGFIIDSMVWRPQIEDLSNEFTVIAWDAPGTGESSDPPDTFTITDWADCLGKLLDGLDIKQAHILGLSWGGILAQEFYHLCPERVHSLILTGTYAGWKGSLPEPIPEDRLAACMTDASVPREQFVNKYLPGMFRDSPAQDVVEEMSGIMSRFHPEGFKLMAISCAKTDTRELLPNISVPTLLIWGEEDKRSPISIAYQFRDSIPGAELAIIPNAGHVSNLEQPAEFNKIVSDFCRKVG